MSISKVNTVCGSINADKLGLTLIHEHILFGYPGWYADSTIAPFNKALALRKTIALLTELKGLGVQTIVDATPNDCGRDPQFLRELSESTGINIICATGYYNEHEGASAYFSIRNMMKDTIPEIAEMMITEITKGIAGTDIRAGVIKVASSKNSITQYEEKFFKAAAIVQKETGAPVITHTQEATMGPEQADLLIAEGANPSRIMIGHMGDSTDMRYLLTTLAKGVFIGFDRMGLQVIVGCPMDTERIPCIIGLVGAGYEDRLLLSHDSICYWLGRPPDFPDFIVPILKNWHPSHIFKNIIPTLKNNGIKDKQIRNIIAGNPKRLFGG